MRKHYLSALLLLAAAQCTTAQTYSRLIQTKFWASPDTTQTTKEYYYTYSGNRSGAADSAIQYDSWLELKRGTTGTLSDTGQTGTQIWDVHGGLIETRLIYGPAYSERTRSVCDINGNPMVSWMDQKAIDRGDTFINYVRNEYTFNSRKVLDSMISYAAVDGGYLPYSAFSYRFDAAGRQTEEYTWKGYPYYTTLNVTYKNVNIYDASGKLIRDLSCPWNTTKAAWDTSFGHQYHYSSAGDLDTMQYISPRGDGTWKLGQINTYEYDAAHRMTRQTLATSTSAFNVYDYTWEGDSIRRTTFLNGAATLDSAGIIIEKYNAGKQLLFRERWSRSTGTWVFENATSYVYEQFTLSATTITKGNLNIDLWPVPAGEQLNLHIKRPAAGAATLLLYDLQGKVWFVKDLQASSDIRETIPTAALPAGIYCVQIKGQQGEMAVRKVTITH